jgi:hypothetical protein
MSARPRLDRYGFAAALIFVLLYAFPYFPRIRSANELPRVYLVMAMGDEATFAIDSGVKRYGTTADVSPSGAHYYSNKAPGSSMLALPGYLAQKGLTALIAGRAPTLAAVTWMCRVTTGILPTLLFLWLLWGFLRRFAPEPQVRRLVLVAYGLGSMAMTYSLLFISHQIAAICVAGAWIIAIQTVSGERSPRWMWLSGFLLGAAPLMDYQAAFAGLPVAVHVLYLLVRRERARPGDGSLARSVLRTTGAAAAGAALPVAMLLVYHYLCFGSPLRTGYDASQTFAHFHQQGFLGITALRWAAFVGSTVAPDNGLVFFSPWLLLALPGVWLLARTGGEQRSYAVVAVSVAAIYLLFISSINFWRGGWQLGPRYITAMLPFMLPAVAAVLSRIESRQWLRGVACSSIVVAVIVYSLSAIEYPHFPERFPNPLYDITFRLIADGHAAPNLGGWLGLSGPASLVPYLLVLFALMIAVLMPARRHLGSAALAVVVAVLWIAAIGRLPRGDSQDDAAYRQWVAGAMATSR